jgi:hypothetical protein
MKLERHDRLPTRKSEAVLRRHPLKSPPLKHRCNKVAARDKAVAAIEAGADRAAANVLPIVAEIRKSGATTLRAIAAALNARGVPTSRGGQWHAMTVRNVLARGNLLRDQPK